MPVRCQPWLPSLAQAVAVTCWRTLSAASYFGTVTLGVGAGMAAAVAGGAAAAGCAGLALHPATAASAGTATAAAPAVVSVRREMLNFIIAFLSWLGLLMTASGGGTARRWPPPPGRASR
jgi:hypothetical protein